MFARSGKLLVVVALVLTTGFHWTALQTLAWATMLASNLHTHSVSEAVSATFDGRHPCCMCKAIAAAKKSEKKSEAVSASLKMEFPPVAQKIILHPPAQFETLPVTNAFAESLAQKPLLQPPRGFYI